MIFHVQALLPVLSQVYAHYINGNVSKTFTGHTLKILMGHKTFVLNTVTTIPTHFIDNHLLSHLVFRNNYLSLLAVVTAKLLYHPCC